MRLFILYNLHDFEVFFFIHGKKTASHFCNIWNCSIAIIRIHFAICEVRSDNSNPALIRAQTFTYQGVRNISFSKYFGYVLNEWSLSVQMNSWSEFQKFQPKILLMSKFTTMNFINPFHANGSFLYALKMSENLWFSGGFKGYRNEPLTWNNLVIKASKSQSRGPVFKTAGCLQCQLSLSSFQGRLNDYQELLGTEW